MTHSDIFLKLGTAEVDVSVLERNLVLDLLCVAYLDRRCLRRGKHLQAFNVNFNVTRCEVTILCALASFSYRTVYAKNVLRAAGLDPDEYTGFYVNIGLDRLVMMRYGVDDVRLFHSGDLRFLQQFR